MRNEHTPTITELTPIIQFLTALIGLLKLIWDLMFCAPCGMMLADMANQEHLDILAKGVDVWNAWRFQNPEMRPELDNADLHAAKLNNAMLGRAFLRGTNLADADLIGATFANSDLTDTLLDRANLTGANLNVAMLVGATLTEANLWFARFYGSILNDANLSGASLEFTVFRDASLAGANLNGARLRAATFGGIDLSTVQNLETVKHDAASTIGLDTIYKSKGRIPESFLRGAGVPDNFIAYIRSLTGAAFDFYSCFISYSTKDQEFADRLYADLQAKGVRCWFAPHDIQGGRKLHEQIDEAIRVYDKLLLILSDASMNSEWVATEISKARKRELKENRRMLFPISLAPFEAIRDWECFDADAGKDSAREVREYFVPDFSTWKDHDSYQRAFERLMRDLKAGPDDKAAQATL